MFTERSRRSSRPPAAAAVGLARLLLPSRCLACRRRPLERLFRGGVCERCWDLLPPTEPHRCEICDDPLSDLAARACGRCLIEPPAYESLRAAAAYRGAARQILLAFKFRGADYLAPHLAAVMMERIAFPRGVAEVAPVPATRRTRLWTDHAAELLAAAVAARLDLPFAPRRLEKTRETERQSKVPLERREANVRGAFRARGSPPRALLLVDDVATSGSTARECARRLVGAGAERVLVWCFARASRLDADPEPAEEEGSDA